MEETTKNSNAGKGLGTASLVLGIVAAVVSFIPCLGMWALVPGVIGLVLSIISISQANKAGAPKGMAIAGLVCSIIGCCVGAWWLYALFVVQKAATEIDPMLKEQLENLDTAKLRQEMNAVMESLTDSLQQH